MNPFVLTALAAIAGTLFIVYLAAPVALAVASVITGHVRDRRCRRLREMERLAKPFARVPPHP